MRAMRPKALDIHEVMGGCCLAAAHLVFLCVREIKKRGANDEGRGGRKILKILFYREKAAKKLFLEKYHLQKCKSKKMIF